jgi:hypothetical protein
MAANDDYVQSDETVVGPDGQARHLSTTVHRSELSFDTMAAPEIDESISITTTADIAAVFEEIDKTTVGAVASGIVAAIPPEYQSAREQIIQRLGDSLPLLISSLMVSTRLWSPLQN